MSAPTKLLNYSECRKKIKAPFAPGVFNEFFSTVQDNNRKQTRVHITAAKKLLKSCYPVQRKDRHHLSDDEQQALLPVQLERERTFQDGFLSTFVLGFNTKVKKNKEPAMDNTIYGLSIFLEIIHAKVMEETTEYGEDPAGRDTFASRFTATVVKFLSKGCEASNKEPRYWTMQVMKEIASNLGDIDGEILNKLRNKLRARLEDKDAQIRAAAVEALCLHFTGSAEEEPSAEQLDTIRELLCLMEEDQSHEVRATVATKLPPYGPFSPDVNFSPDVQTTLVRRLSDVHIFVRQAVLRRFRNPTMAEPLTTEQRCIILRRSLTDRDDLVCQSADMLVSAWLAESSKAIIKEENGPPILPIQQYMLFIDSLDPVSDREASRLACTSIFSTSYSKAAPPQRLEFDDLFWQDLSTTSVVLLRAYIEYLRKNQYTVHCDEATPLASTVVNAMKLQHERRPENPEDADFMLTELLELALLLDYSDQYGSKEMENYLYVLLEDFELPATVVTACMELFTVVTPKSIDRVNYLVPMMAFKSLHDPDEADESSDMEDNSSPKPPTRRKREDLSPEEIGENDRVDEASLLRLIELLRGVNDTLDNNVQLTGIVEDLVFPNIPVHNTVPNPHLRELAWTAAILITLIDNNKRRAQALVNAMIDNSMNESPSLRLIMQKGICDLLVHLGSAGLEDELFKKGIDHLMTAKFTEAEEEILCLGLGKLLVGRSIAEKKYLIHLAKEYFLSTNEGVKQSLLCFFNTIGFSGPENKARLAEICIDSFDEVYTKRLEDQRPITLPGAFLDSFLHWTHPEKFNLPPSDDHDKILADATQACIHLHLEIASHALRSMLVHEDGHKKEDRKALCQCLSRLYMPESESFDSFEAVKIAFLATKVRARIVLDKPTSRQVEKFHDVVVKEYNAGIEGLEESEWRKHEELKEFFKDLDDICPIDGDEDEDVKPFLGDDESEDIKPRITRSKRKSTTMSPSSEDDDDAPSTSKHKRARVTASPAPRPKRKAVRSRPQQEPIYISSDSESDEPQEFVISSDSDEPDPRTIAPRRSRPSETVSKIERDISALLSVGEPLDDSIMGPEDSTDEENSVAAQLVDDSGSD